MHECTRACWRAHIHRRGRLSTDTCVSRPPSAGPMLTPSLPRRRSPPLDLTVSSMSVMTCRRVSPYLSSLIRTTLGRPVHRRRSTIALVFCRRLPLTALADPKETKHTGFAVQRKIQRCTQPCPLHQCIEIPITVCVPVSLFAVASFCETSHHVANGIESGWRDRQTQQMRPHHTSLPALQG